MLYMRTTMDALELPIAVAESPTELARMLGTKQSVVSSSISHKRKGWYRVPESQETDWYPDNDGGLWRFNKDGCVEYKD